LGDPLLAPFFDDIDMARQVATQAASLTISPGGPDRCTGRDLRTARAGLAGLTDEHVGRVIGHLAQTLRELGWARTTSPPGPSRPAPGDGALNR
jgi:truncated hemoglobin YjbI